MAFKSRTVHVSFRLPRMRKTPSSTFPERLSSESSDSETEESLFGPSASGRSPLKDNHNQSRTADPSFTPNRADISCFRRGSDRELQAFISMRNQADKATEEWEKLNYDIHTLCYTRREVRSRWKKILLQLGFQCEVDSLLCVNRQSRFSPDQEHLNKATDLLKQLLDHTSLFPTGTEHHNRYLQVMDRLVSLDSAEEFIRLAREKYPKKEG
ncbi:melanoregulin-like [Nothobranchius furzeri]|uniref:Melanoregulin-like n=1 Tax=Nothobranchius furzeri TaxID=105023 RepID=A0A9D2Y8R1_NOTFU|nr:melanoregulin-like [Nothobranchius furzeri]